MFIIAMYFFAIPNQRNLLIVCISCKKFLPSSFIAVFYIYDDSYIQIIGKYYYIIFVSITSDTIIQIHVGSIFAFLADFLGGFEAFFPIRLTLFFLPQDGMANTVPWKDVQKHVTVMDNAKPTITWNGNAGVSQDGLERVVTCHQNKIVLIAETMIKVKKQEGLAGHPLKNADINFFP